MDMLEEGDGHAAASHVRPKVRSCRSGTTTAAAASWSAARNDKYTVEDPSGGTLIRPETSADGPISILRKPKYSHRAAIDAEIPFPSQSYGQSHGHDDTTGNEVGSQKPNVVKAVKEAVMERPRVKKKNKQPKSVETTSSADEVEGYTPRTTTHPNVSKSSLPISKTSNNHQNNNNNNHKSHVSDSTEKNQTVEEALIFSSLADLMETAGTLPSKAEIDKEGAAAVEADLQFSVMTQEDFEKRKEEDRQLQYEIFTGTVDPLSEKFPEDGDKENSEDDRTAEDSEDGIWGLLDGEEEDNDDEEARITREPRAFLKIWNALAQWVTPEAVQIVQLFRDPSRCDDVSFSLPSFERTDIEASRCAGLMALLKIHIPACIEELDQSSEYIRTNERRLGDLLRCFNYSRPSPKLDNSLARAVACILLDTISPARSNRQNEFVEATRQVEIDGVPPSCKAVGMTEDEYSYLVRSGITNFGS